MSEIINSIPPEKYTNGRIEISNIFELDDKDRIDDERKHIWIQYVIKNEIENILKEKTIPFKEYLLSHTPHKTRSQQDKKLSEYLYVITTLNKILPEWTDITHDPSRIRIIGNEQESSLHNLTKEISSDEKPITTISPQGMTYFPQSYYLNDQFFLSKSPDQKINTLIFYQETDIKKHFSYINFDPIQPSIVSLYKEAIKTGIDPSKDIQFQHIYIKSLLGYMNGVKTLYKALIMGELMQQVRSNNENIYLLIEEIANKITHHSLITYIQRSGIVFPLQTIALYKKSNGITVPNDESVKDILTYWTIGSDKKKHYDGIAQSTADDELNPQSKPIDNKHQKTNNVLKYLSTHGYDFLPTPRRGIAHITDEQTNKTIERELDIVEYQGNQTVWKKVWDDMKRGVLDEVLKTHLHLSNHIL